MARLAVDPDVPAALLDDAMDGGQPQAGALADSLVVKNGSKMLRLDVLGVMPLPVSLIASMT